MRRIQLDIDDSLDEALSRTAEQRGVSKAAVIRDALSAMVSTAHADDPWRALTGIIDTRSCVDDVDAVIYEQ